MTASAWRMTEEAVQDETLARLGRRRILMAMGLVPLGIALGGLAHAAEAVVCGGEVSLAQKNRRKGLGYVDASPDAKRRCSLCVFFTAGSGDCGTCQMLSGGPVNTGAVCNSFAPKQG